MRVSNPTAPQERRVPVYHAETKQEQRLFQHLLNRAREERHTSVEYLGALNLIPAADNCDAYTDLLQDCGVRPDSTRQPPVQERKQPRTNAIGESMSSAKVLNRTERVAALLAEEKQRRQETVMKKQRRAEREAKKAAKVEEAGAKEAKKAAERAKLSKLVAIIHACGFALEGTLLALKAFVGAHGWKRLKGFCAATKKKSAKPAKSVSQSGFNLPLVS